jgi:hypothetical protein
MAPFAGVDEARRHRRQSRRAFVMREVGRYTDTPYCDLVL